MNSVEIAVVGAGPAGLSAALAAARQGATVALIERDERLGGQLIKQTHKFFGSGRQEAGTRGFVIARRLAAAVEEEPGIEVRLASTVLGYYSDKVLYLETPDGLSRLRAERTIMATGAAERMLPFAGNDRPGVYGAGAVQTLMNVHGVRPGKRVLMVGAGNIGLIVSYQLLQARVEVAAVVEAAPFIGGYLVHAAKIRRAGVPILTGHSVKEAVGEREVQGAVVWRLDEKWHPLPGTEEPVDCDVICLATGLTPLSELMWQAGCKMVYLPELGGHVAWHDEDMRTTVEDVYVAGDSSGVEEASAAMVGGRLAGLCAAASLGHDRGVADKKAAAREELAALRAGPTGERIRTGLAGLRKAGGLG
ncbi:MAG TPA: FAD-dependent oxidoreductase [Bacillota bacterium]|jgi:sarcosine oxidase subunit alpha